MQYHDSIDITVTRSILDQGVPVEHEFDVTAFILSDDLKHEDDGPARYIEVHDKLQLIDDYYYPNSKELFIAAGVRINLKPGEEERIKDEYIRKRNSRDS